jgi:hypothetical protein
MVLRNANQPLPLKTRLHNGSSSAAGPGKELERVGESVRQGCRWRCEQREVGDLQRQSAAQHGTARLSTAQQDQYGSARLSTAQHDSARLSAAQHGCVRLSTAETRLSTAAWPHWAALSRGHIFSAEFRYKFLAR